MNRAVMWKTWHDTAMLFVLLLVTVFVWEHVFVFGIRSLAGDIVKFSQRFPFFLKLIQTLMGGKLEVEPNATSLITLGFSHPFLYSVMWTFIVANCTRVLLAEIDRGTADLLVTLPVSRVGIYTSVSAVWLLAGVPACAMPWLGIWFAVRAFPLEEALDFGRLALPIVNMYLLYAAIGCVTMWISTLYSRRGPAIAVVIGILLASFIINFLVAMVPSLHWMGHIGLLQYYRPLESVRSGHLPLDNLMVLGGVAVVTWLAGLWGFSRRDIPAA